MITGVVVSFVHTVLPAHWAPFVVAARARRWDTPALLTVAMAGALAHTLSTAFIGALAVAVGLALGTTLRVAAEKNRGSVKEIGCRPPLVLSFCQMTTL